MVLLNRGSSFYEVINIPRKLFPVFRKKQIWISLHTTDKKVASIRSCSIIAKVNARFLREEQMLNLTGFENNSDDDIDEMLTKLISGHGFFHKLVDIFLREMSSLHGSLT